MINQKGFGAVIIICGVLLILASLYFAYNLGKQGVKVASPVIKETLTEKPICLLHGCWFDTYDGKMGYGVFKGYYTTTKRGNLSCDGLIPSDPGDELFHNYLMGKDYTSDDKPFLSLDLKNLSDELKQEIKLSTKDQPVTLRLVQVPAGGSEFKGCLPATAHILDLE